VPDDLFKCSKCDGYLDELKQLWKLVPEAELLRRMANHVANSYIWSKNDNDPPQQMAEDVDNARALAIRIKAARKEIGQRAIP